jgi:hypothetical protein
MPYDIELPDGTLVEIPDGMEPGVARKLVIGKYAGTHGVPSRLGTEGSNARAALTRGVAGLMGIVPGVTGFVTGDYENAPLAKTVKDLQKDADKRESPELTYKKLLMDRAIDKAGESGMTSQAYETLKQLVSNPSITGLKMLEMVPDLVATIGTGGIGALAGKGAVKYLAKEATEDAAKAAAAKYGTRAAIGEAAVAEGSSTGNEVYDEVYRLELKKKTPEAKARQIATSAARKAQAAQTGISGLTAAVLPGVEKTFFGKEKTSLLKKALGEGSQELTEGVSGQGIQNIAANASDQSIPLSRNVGRAGAEGLTLGTLAGGAAGIPSALRTDAVQTKPSVEDQTVKTEEEPPALEAAQVAATPEEPTKKTSGNRITELRTKAKEEVDNISVQIDDILLNNPELKEKAEFLAKTLGENKGVKKENQAARADILAQVEKLKAEVGTKQKQTDIVDAATQIAGKDVADEAALRTGVQNEPSGTTNQTVPDVDVRGNLTGVDLAGSAAGVPNSGEVQTPAPGGMAQSVSNVAATDVGTESEQPALNVVGFKTEKGSTYVLTSDGKTSRTKRSPGKGQGTIYEPHTVMYVNPGDHTSIMSDMQSSMGNASVRLGYVNEANVFKPVQNNSEIPAGSQPVVGVFNKKTNDLISMYEARTAPHIGMHPVEKLYNPDGTASTHVGNKIVELENKKEPIQGSVNEQAATPDVTAPAIPVTETANEAAANVSSAAEAPVAQAKNGQRKPKEKAAPAAKVEAEEDQEEVVKPLTDEELKTYRLPDTTPTAQSQQVSSGLKKITKKLGLNLDLTPRVNLDYGRAVSKINALLLKLGKSRTAEERAMHAYVKGVQSINSKAGIEDVFRYLAHDLADATSERQKNNAQAARTYVEKALGKDALTELDNVAATTKNNIKAASEGVGRLTSNAGLESYKGKENKNKGIGNIGVSKEDDIRRVLEKIISSGTASSVERVIAERMLQLIADNPPKLVFANMKGIPAKFDPAVNTITIDPEYFDTNIVLHEVAHALIDHAIDNPKKLNDRQKDALARLKNIFESIPQDKKEEYNASTLKEFVAQVLSNSDFQRELRATKFPQRPFSFFTEFTRTIAGLFGINPGGNAFAETLDVIDQLLSVPSATMKGKEVSFAPGDQVTLTSPTGETINVGTVPAEPAGTATKESNKRKQLRTKRENNLVKLEKQGVLARMFPTIFKRWGDYNFLVRKFENERRPVQTIQEGIVAKGALITSGPKTNAVSIHLDQAASRSSALYNERVSPTIAKLNGAITKFARLTNTKVDEAMDRLNKYFIALHEPERRQAIFYRKVRDYLDTNGQSEHQRIFEKLYDDMNNALPVADIQKLRTDLDKVIQNDPKLSQKLQDEGITLDQFRDSDIFDVVGIKADVAGPNGKPTGEQIEVAMTSDMQKQFADSFTNMPEDVKAALEEIRSQNQALNKIILDLDKQGRYIGPQVENIVNFYGFKNYVPFRGLNKDADEDVVDPRSKRLGGELAQAEQSMEGRVTEPENVLARNRVQAVRAAQRPARFDLTLAIKNAVASGFIAGPFEAKKISFKERVRDEGRDKLPKAGENVVYHYGDGGNVYIVKIEDPIVSRAFRQTYVDSNPLVKGLNALTKPIAKGFTFYNPQFWLTNFVSDVFTNATVFAAEDAKGTQFLRTVASDIVRNKLFSKTVTFTRLYNQGTEASWKKLRELAEKDEYFARALEFVGSEAGGKTAYVSGFSTDTQMQQILDNLSPNRYRQAKNTINGFFSVASDTFELTSRLAAFKTYRDMGLSPLEAANKTKNLANFEHVGEWGRGLGSWFMFFRQSATGAVRAVDALAKGKYGPQTALTMAAVGFAAYMFAALISGDDEDGNNRVFNDDADRWTRNARFFLPGMEDPFQMRWGFGINGFAAAGSQMAALIFGRSTLSQFVENTFKDILTENLLPIPLSKMNLFESPITWLLDTIVPAPVKPLVQLSANRDALDRAIISSTRGGQRFQDPYAFNQNVPAWIRDFSVSLSEATNAEVSVSPNVINFMLSNYLGAVHKFADAGDNLIRAATGDQDLDVLKATMIFKGFSGTAANVDIADFYKMRNQMEAYERAYKTLERRGGDALEQYEERYPERIEAHKLFSKANAKLINPLNKARNDIKIDPDLSSKEKKELIKEITNEQKVLMKEIMEDVNDILKP